MTGRRVKVLVGGLLAAGLIFLMMSDVGLPVSVAELRDRVAVFKTWYQEDPLLTLAGFMAAYIVSAALSLPLATLFTLAGGALFGLPVGVVVVSFAASIGATLAFLMSRYLLRDWVQARFGHRLSAINRGIETEGGLYLFTLRVVPAFPFFVVNLVMGVTPISIKVFYLATQLGMLPVTLIYVNAGTVLSQIQAPGDIVSGTVLISLSLMGVFPLIMKRIMDRLRSRRVYAPYKRPKRFDYNVVVIGGGAAGLVAAYLAATLRATVALVEERRMGGDCLNTGCVPSKAFIAAARQAHLCRCAREMGVDTGPVSVRFDRVMARVHQTVAAIAPHDSVERYTDLGVSCFSGRGVLISPFEVAVGDRVLTARSIILATGAAPAVPDIPGLKAIPFLTSDTLWGLTALPPRLVVLGGGPVACELGQAFQRLGSRVTLIHRGDRLLKREDPEVSELIRDRLVQEGMDVRLNYRIQSCARDGERSILICVAADGTVHTLAGDQVLIALGRTPRTEGMGLENLGIERTRDGAIGANRFLQTRFPNIYCCGDVHGRYQFTHTAAHEAYHASLNALFGGMKKCAVDYRVIPMAVFTDPEVARVGLTEQEARDTAIPHETVVYDLADLDRAIADGQTHGFVKVLTIPGKDRILGVTIVGHHAADILSEFVLAMRHGIGLNKVLGTIHIYPTMAEANKYAAGLWKKQHAPRAVLGGLARFHTWMRHV